MRRHFNDLMSFMLCPSSANEKSRQAKTSFIMTSDLNEAEWRNRAQERLQHIVLDVELSHASDAVA